MFTRMGVACYSIGGAYDALPFEGKRPALPAAPRFPSLEAATNEQRARLSHDYGDPGPAIDWAKARLAPEVIDWADTIIVHHFPEQWIGGNWPNIRDKRVIWRTCGQSDPRVEREMAVYVEQGLQVVRYSPKERTAFTGWGSFAGEDAMIRFGKDPDEWSGWRGDDPFVGNITQDMFRRGDACGLGFWEVATRGLPTKPAGPGSEMLVGGIGSLDYDEMREYLRSIRVYLYTGTRPASYTLGLIEAMMTGVPVISIGANAFQPPALFEAHEITSYAFDDPQRAHDQLWHQFLDPDNFDHARGVSAAQRADAIELFGLDTVMAQWRDFLGLVPFGWEDPTPTWGTAA